MNTESVEFQSLISMFAGSISALDAVGALGDMLLRKRDGTGLRQYLSIPAILSPSVLKLIDQIADENGWDLSAEDCQKGGKLHSAISTLQSRLQDYAEKKSIPLPLGDWSFAGLMDAATGESKPRRGDYSDIEYNWWVL